MPRETFLKLCIIGATGTGKTSLVHRFADNTFEPNRTTTIGCDYKMKVVDHTPRVGSSTGGVTPADGKGARLVAPQSRAALAEASPASESFIADAVKRKAFTMQLFDIAGQDKTLHLVRSFYQGAMGAVVVADASREATLADAVDWRKTLIRAGATFRQSDVNIPVVLVVNKCDMFAGGDGNPPPNSPFVAANLDKFCEENGFAAWVMTSARTGEGVDEAFRVAIDAVVDVSILVGAGQSDDAVREQQKQTIAFRRSKREKGGSGCKC